MHSHSSPIRVVHIHGDLVAGGGQTLSREWLRGVDRTRIDPYVVALGEPLTLHDSFVEAGIDVTVLSGWRPFQVLKLMRYFKKHQIDIVHTESEYDRKVGHVAVWLSGLPVIAHLHSSWVYFLYPIDKSSFRRSLKTRLVRAIRRLSDRAIAHYIPTSIDVSDACAPKTSVPMTVVEPGISSDFREKAKESQGNRSEIRERYGIADDEIAVISVSRLERPKNLEDFLDVIEKLSSQIKVKGIIAGSGSLHEELVARVNSLGLNDYVTFIGPVQEVTDVYAAGDVYLSTSTYESFGMSVLESMYSGVPVVAYALDIFRIYQEGSYLPAHIGDTDQLAENIRLLLADSSLRDRVIFSARGDADQFMVEDKIEILTCIDEHYVQTREPFNDVAPVTVHGSPV